MEAHPRTQTSLRTLGKQMGDFSLIPIGFRRNPLSYRRLAMILASISGGQSLGKPLPDLSRQVKASAKGSSRSLAASPSRSSLRMLSASTRSLANGRRIIGASRKPLFRNTFRSAWSSLAFPPDEA